MNHYSPRRLAAEMGVSINTVYRMIRQGDIQAEEVQFSGDKPRYVIPVTEAKKALDKSTRRNKCV